MKNISDDLSNEIHFRYWGYVVKDEPLTSLMQELYWSVSTKTVRVTPTLSSYFI
jgi:hypothetical protein